MVTISKEPKDHILGRKVFWCCLTYLALYCMLRTHINQCDICAPKVFLESTVQEYFILMTLRLEEGHSGTSLLEGQEVGACTQGILVIASTNKQNLR